MRLIDKPWQTGGRALPALALFVAAALAAPGMADEPSLDEKLLDNLDNELLKGLEEQLKPVAKPKTDGKKPMPAGAEKRLTPEPAGEDIGQPGEEDALSRVGKRMRASERLIPKLDSVERTTQEQKRIVADLSKLIEDLEKQCKQCQSAGAKSSGSQKTASRQGVKQPKPPADGQGKQPATGPAKESTNKLRKDQSQRVDLAALHGLIEQVWGQLPEHVREQMLQSPPEEFLPEFELELEKYYKRLAEQPSGGR